jgi:acyl-CoA thioesterase-1
MINGDLNQNMSQFFQADGLHPNAEGVTKIIESIDPVFLKLIEATSQK